MILADVYLLLLLTVTRQNVPKMQHPKTRKKCPEKGQDRYNEVSTLYGRTLES
jgi:hypothetical protein